MSLFEASQIEYSSKAENSSKFYRVSLSDATVVIHYGRRGALGQSKAETFRDSASAARRAQSALGSKYREGYVPAAPRTIFQGPAVAGHSIAKSVLTSLEDAYQASLSQWFKDLCRPTMPAITDRLVLLPDWSGRALSFSWLPQMETALRASPEPSFYASVTRDAALVRVPYSLTTRLTDDWNGAAVVCQASEDDDLGTFEMALGLWSPGERRSDFVRFADALDSARAL